LHAIDLKAWSSSTFLVQPQQAADPRWIAVAQSAARVKSRIEAA